MKITPKMWCEAVIGSTQIFAQWVGSTTLTGASVYEVVIISWWAWMITWRMWGFLPLNIAGFLVSTWNLLKALGIIA